MNKQHFQHIKSLLTIASLYIISVAVTNAAVITFDEYLANNTSFKGKSLAAISDDNNIFEVSLLTSGNLRVLGSSTFNYSGSPALSTSSGEGTLSFSSINVPLFNLNSLDIAPTSEYSLAPASVVGILTAYTTSGTVVHNFSVNQDSYSYMAISPNIKNVSSFTITFNNNGADIRGGQIDNINYTAIPEPTITAFLLAPGALALTFSRRRFHKT